MPARRSHESPRSLLRLLVLALVLAPIGSSLAPSDLRAQACGGEEEPNDVEAEIQPQAGLFCVAGTLPAEDQDLYLWEVDEETATGLVSMRVTGIPATVTTAGVFEVSSEPGVEPVVAGSRLISVTAEPGAVAPATVEFVLGPGEYIVGISRTQTVDGSTPATESYTLEMGAGADWPERGDDEPNDDATTATEVESTFALSGDLKDSADVFSWTLSAEDAASAWELAAQVPINAQAELSLVDEAGATLARIPSSNGVNGRVTLYDLVLEPGAYTVQLSGSRDLPTPYLLTAVAVDRPPFDHEPNEVPAQASAPDFSAGAVTGRLAGSGDVDVYRLSLDDRLAASLFDVKLIRRSAQPLSLCLLAPDGTVLQCKDGEGGVSLADIAIPAGDYSLAVTGEENLDVSYVLRVDATSAPVADYETEPNDGVLVASPFEPSITMRGSFSGVEDDYFRIPVTGDPQLWSVLVEGPGVSGLSLQDANGRELAASAVVVDSGLAELSDLYLPPGDHWIRVRGGDGDYTVRAIPLGPPDPNGEREANNDAVMGEPLLVGQIRTGRIVQTTDLDYFRFSLAARDHVVVDLTGPADGSFLVRLSDGSDELARWDAAAPGEAFSFDGLLEPGDYVIVVGANTPSTERYELTVRRADPFDLADDQEPNGTTTTAGTLPIEGEIRGDVALQNDVDWYVLPEGATDDLELVVDGDNASARLTDGVTEYALEVDDSGERYTTTETLPVDVPLYVIVSGTGTYRLSLGGGDDGGSIFDVPGADDRPVEFPVTAAVSLPVTEVAAYLTVGQRLEGELSLTNTGSESRTLELAAATSHYAWMAEVEEPAVEIGAGQTLTVPVSVTILADAWADVPVRVTVAARDATGGLASAFVEITPTAEAPAVAPIQSWPLPDPLLGGLDVAATSLGAVPVAPLYPEDEAQLHDGITPDGLGYIVEPPFPLSTTVDLAGDAPMPIAGFVVNPQAGDTFSSPPRGVELLLSIDGSTFDSVWSGELSAIPIEQAIVLDQPVEAAYARLIVTSAHSANALDPYAVAIGEWKVIALPGTIPEPYLGADIASGLLGGHVVRLDPQGSNDVNFPLAMLDEDPARWSMRIEPGTRPSFVLGFHNDRAARISEIQWVDPAGSTPESRFDEVEVEVSVGSPLGPWEPLGSWELDREDDGTVAPFVLDEVRWARFLRFTGDAVTEEYTDIEYPATVRVIEQAATDEYRSILGEWGAGRPLGIYEALNPPDLSVVSDEADAPDSPADAAPLTAGEAITGRANIGADVDWYAVTIPDGENTLTFDLTGVPVVDVTVEVFNARQEPVPATLVEGATPGAVQYVAEVEAGETYTVRVAQPQHSIVFAFDTSGSIGPFYDAVFQALRSYTANVEEGQEYVNIVAFDEEPLLDGWTDDPYALSTAVSRYRLEAGSSSAETGVLDSTELLSTQEGTKAILLITDAETSSYQEADEMWRLLETVGPRIFAVQILAQSTHNQSQDWMQDWAISGDGHYQYTRTQAEMDRAFDRAATWLRRPAAYGISYATSQTSTEPGSLRIVSPPVDEAAGEEAVSTISDAVSVEIIYDTSGSMLAAMPDGQRRVDAARTVLVDLVTNKIPAGVPVALRVFGNTPGSCETSLAVPLAPLDPAAMGATIAAIEPVNEVKTPIGASLDQVANDLAGVEGPKIVILVTDGEETCDGDAAAAIERLAAEGVDVQVNIVGFALDDEELKSTFRRWARLGNGTYFDATNAEELDDAIAKAVQAPFRVYDAAGELVASGTVDGGSVRLPAGTYRVVVLTDPETVYEEVVVEPEGRVKLTVGEPPPER